MNIKEEIKNLVEYLNYHTQLYNLGQPEITDKEWDDKYFQLVYMECNTGYILPNSPTQKISWDAVSALTKVEHNHLMLSLDKTKSIDEVQSFIGDNDYIAMLKMDGLTCSLRYSNGHLIKAETRGNGIIGEDILHNARVIKNIPLNIPYKFDITIDGEIICDYGAFEEFKNDFKNPRNFASGGIRCLDPKECEKKNLSFIAWDWIDGMPDDTETLMEKLLKLQDLGFTVVPFSIAHNVFNNLEEEVEWLKARATERMYPIDGIVFKFNNCDYYESLGHTDHHFRGGLAFKFYDEEYETRLKYIEWSMGRTGVLTPVAVFEPIDIDGTEVERASLHNYSVMKDIMGDCCYCGQKIKVFKANMIIPQIKSAIKMSYGDVISQGGVTCDGFSNDYGLTCPVCEGSTSIVESESGVLNVVCDNPQCEGKLINRIDHFFGKKGLDAKGFSMATIQKVIDWGYVETITDCFRLDEHRKDWINKTGFGEKSVTSILTALDGCRNTSLDKVISAAGIPLIGSTVGKSLAKRFKTYDAFRTATRELDFSTLDGFGYEMNNALHKFDYTELDYIVENYLTIEEPQEKETSNDLEGLIFVITGKLKKRKNRDELKAEIEGRGGKVAGSVSSKTNYLINNDINSTTGKNKTAKDLGIPIISEEDFDNNGF